MKFPELSSIPEYAIAIALLAVVTSFIAGFMRKAGADSYDWVRRAVRRDDKKTGESDVVEQDWDTRTIVFFWIRWLLAIPIVISVIKLPILVMPPLFWHSAELLLFLGLAGRNFYHMAMIETFERFYPNGLEMIWGESGLRRRSTKRKATMYTAVILVCASLNSMHERNALRSIADNYCVYELPNEVSRTTFSWTSGIPRKDLDDERLRDMMREPDAREQVEHGFCLR